MKIEDHWREIRILFEKAAKSGKYYAFATVDNAGNPHVTPIGSLILKDNCRGFFFERFPKNMKANFEISSRVAVMAINTGFFYWFKSIRKGKFKSPPGVRLYGTVGGLRQATQEEKDMWLEKVRFAKGTKGYNLLWKDMPHVRDIVFDDFRPVTAGLMTQGLWE